MELERRREAAAAANIREHQEVGAKVEADIDRTGYGRATRYIDRSLPAVDAASSALSVGRRFSPSPGRGQPSAVESRSIPAAPREAPAPGSSAKSSRMPHTYRTPDTIDPKTGEILRRGRSYRGTGR